MKIPKAESAGAEGGAVGSSAGSESYKAPINTMKVGYPEGTSLPSVRRCKLDPSLKATCFQPLILRVHTVLST